MNLNIIFFIGLNFRKLVYFEEYNLEIKIMIN